MPFRVAVGVRESTASLTHAHTSGVRRNCELPRCDHSPSPDVPLALLVGVTLSHWRYHLQCLATLLEASFITSTICSWICGTGTLLTSSFMFLSMVVVHVPRSSSTLSSHLSHQSVFTFWFRPRLKGAVSTLIGHLVLGVCQRLVLHDLLLTVPRRCSDQLQVRSFTSCRPALLPAVGLFSDLLVVKPPFCRRLLLAACAHSPMLRAATVPHYSRHATLLVRALHEPPAMALHEPPVMALSNCHAGFRLLFTRGLRVRPCACLARDCVWQPSFVTHRVVGRCCGCVARSEV